MNFLRIIAMLGLMACAAIPANLGQGVVTCPSSGAKPLATSNTKASWISLQAPTDNTGTVSVGGLTVTTTTGVLMTAGGAFFLPPESNSQAYSLNGTFISCTVAADTVKFTYAQ